MVAALVGVVITALTAAASLSSFQADPLGKIDFYHIIHGISMFS